MASNAIERMGMVDNDSVVGEDSDRASLEDDQDELHGDDVDELGDSDGTSTASPYCSKIFLAVSYLDLLVTAPQ